MKPMQLLRQVISYHNEINIEPFVIDARSLQMQLLDFKNKDLWSGKFTERQNSRAD